MKKYLTGSCSLHVIARSVGPCKPCASFVGLIEHAFWVKKDKGTVVLALILEYLVYAWHRSDL